MRLAGELAKRRDAMAVLDIHEQRLRRSAEIARFQMEDQMDRRFLSPLDVIRVLNREKISFVLVGAYGITGYMNQARATEDVDVVVALKHVKKATRVLIAEFSFLEADDQEVVVRLHDRDTKAVLVDLMKPTQTHLREIFKNAEKIELKKQTYRIPTCEMALVLKFAPMISLNRVDEKKLQDAADFIAMVKKNPEVNLEQLATLGDLVYNGGGKEIVEMVHKVRAGEMLDL
jgi:hypothetical protein